MFRSNKPNVVPSIQRPSTPIECLIGARMTVTGDIVFSGGLNIAGSVKGSIYAEGTDALVDLNESGRIDGDIRAPHVHLHGEMNGDVVATEKLVLGSTARVRGNIFYKLLEMNAGAQVNGQMIHQDEPQKMLPKPEGDSTKA
jgi:cytoskeletal protein CcmA (bactofilin family)